jgi:hypothetical protein
MGNEMPFWRNCPMQYTAKILFGQLFRIYFASPSLLVAHLLTSLCPRVARRLNDFEDASDRDAFVASVRMTVADELALFTARFDLADALPAGEVSSSDYPLISELGADAVIDLFTAAPPSLEDATLLATARRFPSVASAVGAALLDRLRSGAIDGAIAIIGQLMADPEDTHLLLLVQGHVFALLERLAALFPSLSPAQFTPLWCFFLSLFHFITAVGSPLIAREVEAFVAGAGDLLATFLRAFMLRDFGGAATATAESLPALDPLPMCVELLLLLSAPGAPAAVVASGILAACPFLWPSAFTWVIVRADEAGGPLLEQRFPAVHFLNDLFYHAGLSLATTRPRPCSCSAARTSG